MKPQFLFHCSAVDHGETLVVRRQLPHGSEHLDEPPVPRLCVSPCVQACIAARYWNYSGPVHVYRTKDKRKGIKPRGVWDQMISGERWIIPPAELVKVDLIEWDDVQKVSGLFAYYHTYTGRKADHRIRLAMQRQAFEVLGDRFPNPRFERFTVRAADGFGIDNPVRWVERMVRDADQPKDVPVPVGD